MSDMIKLIEAWERQETAITKPHRLQRYGFLSKRGLRFHKRRDLVRNNGAAKSQLFSKTPNLTRKARHCYPRGKAWRKVELNTSFDWWD